jgi:hypothetical protein
MKENNYGIQTENTGAQEIKESMSVGEALTGVITNPSDTFETISISPKKNYWFAPLVFLIIANLIYTFLMFRDEDLKNEFINKQKPAVEKQIDKQIAEGKMTADKKDEAMEMSAKITMIFTWVGSIIGPFIFIFLLGFLYWLVLKIMKADKKMKIETGFFSKILNVVGLSFIIMAVSKIAEIIISIFVGKISTLSLALLISESQVGAKFHMLISNAGAFTIWGLIVTAIGIAKISGQKQFVGYAIVIGFWILFMVISYIGLSFSMQN